MARAVRGGAVVRRVLVVGVPRSGTSWVGRLLGSTAGATYVGEPDNHGHAPFAFRAKLGLPGWFYSAPRDADGAEAYERLWRSALGFPRLETSAGLGLVARARRKTSGRLLQTASGDELRRAFQAPGELRRALRLAAALAVPERPERAAEAIVVKSVQAQLALDWIASRFPVEVLLVVRHPLNVVSSWVEMGWIDSADADPLGELDPRVAGELERRLGVPPPEPGSSPLAQATWLIGLLSSVVLDAARRHPGWHTVVHEELCEQPHERFAETATRLGLRWTEPSDRLLDRLDRPGRGYETARLAAGLAEIWRERLTPEQVREAAAVLAGFPVDDWSARPSSRA